MQKVRHFLEVMDLKPNEVKTILNTAIRWKKHGYNRSKPLAMKQIALIFQKPSTRTRVSFQAAISKLGGDSFYLGWGDLQLGRGESVEDTGKVLGRYVDAIVARVFSHQDLLALSSNGKASVINALSDRHHPCQALADVMTVFESSKQPYKAKIAYVGDGNNVCTSLMQACALLGLHIFIATPPQHRPPHEEVQKALEWAEKSKGEVVLTDDPREAVRDADFVYTDVFVSMGQEKERAKRLEVFLPTYQVNEQLMSLAKSSARFMHCMPMHLNEEVTPEVAYGTRSIIYEQAENRMHTAAALLDFILNVKPGA